MNHTASPLEKKGIFSSFPAHPAGQVASRLFKFFASVQLAIPLLLTLIGVLAAGTFVESYHGTDAARIVVYQSPWFGFLLFLIAVNLTAAALSRLPWKVKHTGFVITHIGIILVLTGSWLTSIQMIDGQMIIAEGATEYRINISEPLLYIYSEETERNWLIPLQKHAFPWAGVHAVKAARDSAFPLNLALTAYYPKARMRENLMPAETGPAALQVRLKNSFVDQSQWLIQNDAERGNVQMGPAKLQFTDTLLKENAAPAPETGYLELQFEKSSQNIPLPPDLKTPAVFPVEGTPYQIQVTRVLKGAAVVGKELVESPDTVNPAVELTLNGPGLSEKHTVFSKYPDFPTVHGMKPSAAGLHIFYRMPNGGSKGESHELRFALKDGKLLYQVRDGFDIKTGEVETGKEVELGWMGMTFQVNTFYPNASVNRSFTAEPNTSESEDVLPAVRLQISGTVPKSGDSPQTLWLRQGYEETVEVDGNKYQVVFGEKRIPAGFKLKLKDFRVENYPGTEKPASFESDVTLLDSMTGTVKDATVSMNKPLVYNGYRIYQSAFSLQEGQAEVSIFSVGKDPGVPVKYTGVIIMLTGIITMFYTRKFSSTAGRML